MSDHIQSLTVVLDKDYRGEDVQGLCDAIARYKGVLSVHQGTPVDVSDFLARQRVKSELSHKLLEVVLK